MLGILSLIAYPVICTEDRWFNSLCYGRGQGVLCCCNLGCKLSQDSCKRASFIVIWVRHYLLAHIIFSCCRCKFCFPCFSIIFLLVSFLYDDITHLVSNCKFLLYLDLNIEPPYSIPRERETYPDSYPKPDKEKGHSVHVSMCSPLSVAVCMRH